MQVSTRAHAIAAAVAAAGVLLVGALDVLRGAPHLGVVLGARAIWAAALLGIAAYILRARDRQLPLPAAVAAVASVGALTALAWTDGISGTGSISYLITAPLFVVAIVPDPRVAAAGAVASLAGTLGVGAARGLGGVELATIAILSAFAGGFAIFGSVLQERARRTEVALAAERARAKEALAASERRRAEAEPLAVAGSRAAAAAHDMAGPIAAICANLAWLEEALKDGRVSAADPEVPEVVGDARTAVEALVRALSDLRRASETAKRARAAGERTVTRAQGGSVSGE